MMPSSVRAPAPAVEDSVGHLGDRPVAAERDDEAPPGLRLPARDGAGVARPAGEGAVQLAEPVGERAAHARPARLRRGRAPSAG